MSWLSIPSDSHFSLANLPFGIISTPNNATPRPAVAIGEHVLDLAAFASAGGFASSSTIAAHKAVFTSETTLNAFAALGRPLHRETRSYLQKTLREADKDEKLRDVCQRCLVPRAQVTCHLPMAIGDYTDFYAGKNHAFNVGVLFRGAANALQPNYTHLPVAYHGRASSVVVSGTPIRRPWGQVLRDPKAETKIPELAKCARFDIELEMGMFLCKGNKLGEPVPVAEADDYVFGYVLMNDWSARDIQAWEYVPLGPFTSKNCGTSISPWVVLADALEGAKAEGLENNNELLPYLKEKKGTRVLDISLEVDLITPDGAKTTITRTTARNLLWSWPQMIAHHTITGCNMRPGDLLGSGTISGTESGSEGSLLEQTGGGKTPRALEGGGERKFLEDGDTVTIRGWWEGQGGQRVGFGEVSGKIEAALPLF